MSKFSVHDLWVIVAGYLAAIHVGKLSAVIPILQKDLGLSFTQAGFSLSLIQAAGMLFALFIGAFSERFGLKRCFIAALVILGCSSIAGLWVQNAMSLYFFRFTEGVGFLTISLCAPAILKRMSTPETLNFKMGLWSSYMGAGVSLAVLTIPILLEWLSWQHIWVMFGGGCLIMAIIIKQYLYFPEFSQQTTATEINKTAQSSLWHLIKITITHPPVVCLAIIFACYTSQWTTVTGFLPSMYVMHDLDLKLAGLLVSIVVIANLGGTFSAGLLLQRGIPPQRLLWIGFSTMFITSLLIFTTNAWLSFELQVLSAILFSLIGGIIPTTVFAITLNYTPLPTAAAASVGLVIQVSALGQFFIPPLSAAVVSATSQWANIAIITCCLCTIGISITTYLFKIYSSQQES